MIRKTILACIVALGAATCLGYRVSVGTFVSNAGRQVTVPIELDSVAGLSYAGATITYDPQVLVVTKTEAGTLHDVMADDFTSSDTNGTLTVTIFGGVRENAAGGSGSIAKVTFAVREGTAGLYSDLAVTDVSLGEKTGLKDVTVDNPVTTQNGMIRVMAENAAVDRLENAQTICAGTTLGTLTLKPGDAIQAGIGAVRADAVSAAGAIPVVAPNDGWTSGRYELLQATAADLSFSVAGLDDAVVQRETAAGKTTYFIDVVVAGEGEIVCETESFDSDAKAQIRVYAKRAIDALPDTPANAAVKAAFASGRRILVKAPADGTSAALVSDMGLAPAATVDPVTGELRFAYATPKLALTSFDPETGAVRFKVTPGMGNTIVSELATGYVHVYGTGSLADRMRYISKVGFDLTPYLKADTKGEGVINVTLGTHTFLKVKIENVPKFEGDME